MREKKEVNEFQEMYAAHWHSIDACVANRTQRLRALNAPNNKPSTEDLVCFKNYVEQEIKLYKQIRRGGGLNSAKSEDMNCQKKTDLFQAKNTPNSF